MCRTAQVLCEGARCDLRGLPADIEHIGTASNSMPMTDRIACGHYLQYEYLDREKIKPFYCSRGSDSQDPIYCTNHQEPKTYTFPIVCSTCLYEVKLEVEHQTIKYLEKNLGPNPPSEAKKQQRRDAIDRLEEMYNFLKMGLVRSVIETKKKWATDVLRYMDQDPESYVRY